MSEEKKNKNVWTSIVCSVCGIGVGALIMFLCQKCSPLEPVEPIIIRDSIAVHDTAYLAGKTKILSVRDTIYLTKTDTEYQTIDTTDVLVYATKEYCDTFATDTSSIELAVKYSGYNAKIDSIGLNYNFVVQPRIVEKKKGWGQFVGIGVGVGYGASVIQNQVFAAPQIGVSVVYGFGYHW